MEGMIQPAIRRRSNSREAPKQRRSSLKRQLSASKKRASSLNSASDDDDDEADRRSCESIVDMDLDRGFNYSDEEEQIDSNEKIRQEAAINSRRMKKKKGDQKLVHH
jgi:hypothetical protein